MTIGGGIFLAVVGAILLFAVDAEVGGIDINVIGVILLIAGIAGIILGFVMTRPFGNRTKTVETAPRERVVERERPTERVVEREREV
jgi:L-cystine uptake protein TcyP (sodium:dicarboxylate symporter family)